MSQTDTQAVDTAAENGKKARNVDYEMELYDDLPDRPGKSSPIKEAIQTIIDNPPPADKWVCVARYGNGSAATAAANVLRQKYGHKNTVSGFQFATRRVDNGTRTGLFINYDPSKVDDSGKAEHNKWLAERKAKAAAKAQKAEKAAAKK